MKRILITLLAVMSLFRAVMADEGMWIPSLIGEQKLDDMRRRGLKLSAEDLYSINGSSLKDAIVMFGRGCTGAIVSDQGLLLTNHHCGSGAIQRHSAIEHDYLTDGFWAMNPGEELPNPGLTVTLLVRMDDVSERVLASVKEGMTEAERLLAVAEAAKAIIKEATEGTHFTAEVKPLFGGNQYFLYVNEVFSDVRLVGAPPAAVGNFGGDTDNWMWPRHTGDFSVFRIYADSNNLPAPYSVKNQPYRPKRFLEISLAGVDKGDFTMVYGYPASTRLYLPGEMVSMIAYESNPARIAVRREKLDIMGAAMNADPKVRIQYASKYQGVANAWKKWIGESRGLDRFDAVEKKKLKTSAAGFFKDYHLPTDRKLMTAMLAHFREHAGEGGLPGVYAEIDSKFGGDVEAYTAWLYSESFMVTEESVMAFLEGYKPSHAKKLAKDPAYRLMSGFRDKYQDDYSGRYEKLTTRVDSLQRVYISAVLEMRQGRELPADANSTLRVSYGVVNDYYPRDAVYYDYQTTLTGIMEKDDPAIYDYRVPARLKELYAAGDFGRYGQDGVMYTCFTAANHTTGGNSGSPVLNDEGRLLGLNFDRNWEGTMSDIMYDPDMCRNIVLDIRYCLFIMDKYAGAGHLVGEMTLVE